MSWTIWWDMHRHPGAERWNRATEATEAEALERAQRFLRLGFVVYVIRDPQGTMVMDEASDSGSGLPSIQRDEETSMPTGKVKWFNASKGYGFIVADDGGPDVFVHISSVERSGLPTLGEGQIVEYQTEVQKNGKKAATSLKLV